MKKSILILLLVLLSIAGAQAQFCIGPKVGYSASKLSTTIPEIKESMNNNFQIGAFMRLGQKVYFQPEVLYATRGGIFEDTLNLQEEIKFKSLDVPLMVGFHLLNLKVFNFRFMGGPVASFILDKDLSFDENMIDPITESELKDIIWGLDVGLGIDVLFMTLDVRWEFGLNNLYESSVSGENYSINNNLFIVGLGFKLL
jgi:hypothetical protein